MFVEMRKMARVALVAALLVLTLGVATSELQSVTYFEMVGDRDTVELFTHGPFSISATCDGDNDEASLLLTITAEEDEWVHGYPDFARQGDDNACIGLFPAGTSETCKIWDTGAGTSTTGIAGAFQSLSGYYIGFGGNTIGFHRDYLKDENAAIYHQYTADDIAAFPEQFECTISGVLDFF